MPKILTTFFVFYFSVFAIASERNKTIRFRELPLSEFSGSESQKILLRYFLSNPSWDVREERGKIVAYRKPSPHSYSSDGYYKDTTTARDTRLLVSFSGRVKEHRIRVFSEIENKNQSIKLPTSQTELSPYAHQSYLIVKDSSLFIEIFESSKIQKRLFTIKALDELRMELHDVLAHSEEIKKNGFLSGTPALPLDTSLVVSEISPGEFLLSGTWNFREKGSVYARLTAFNGENISGKINRMNSKRPVGWSEQGQYRFHYQTQALNAEIPPGKTIMATIEIIFINTKGVEYVIQKKEQVLLSSFSRRN